MESIQVGQFFADYVNDRLKFDERKPVPALQLSSSKSPAYVEPTISYLGDTPGDKHSILLISAAGAMGKTFTSMAIAEQLASPRLDLSKVTVGEGTHSGILSRTLTSRSYADYTLALEEGCTHLIIDALDEAPIRSGERAFIAFIRSIAEHSLEFQKPNHQFIVLGRPQTIELFAAVCDEVNVKATRMGLDSLSLPSSLRLIGNEISGYPGSKDNNHSQPAMDYWREYLFELARTLRGGEAFHESDWKDVSDFLGYPPVLCAIAPTVREANYIRVAEQLRRGNFNVGSRSKVLAQIIDDLLLRETTKVQNQLAEVFDGDLSEERLRTLYTHEEQIARILRELGISSPYALPVGLPDELRSRYEESIQTFIMDHPFLDGQPRPKPRNSVFSDYLRSIINVGTEYFTTVTQKPLASLQLLPVGPFYVHFMEDLLNEGPGELSSLSLRNEDYVSDIWASWVAGAHSDQMPILQYIHRVDTTPLLDLHMETSGLPIGVGGESPRIAFNIAFPSGILQLKSPLQNMFISTDHCVYVASSAGSITFGPDLFLLARSIESELVDEIVVRATSHDGSPGMTYLLCEEFGLNGDYKVRKVGGNPAFVAGPNMDQRWIAFKPSFEGLEGISQQRSTEAVMSVRRILASFRSSNGALAINADKFNFHVIGRNELLIAIARAMKSAGLISERSGLVVANQAGLSRLGISYETYSNPDWATKMNAALQECLSHDDALYRLLVRQG